MEDAETVEEALGERPALAPVEQDGEDERGVDRALGGKRDIPRAETRQGKEAAFSEKNSQTKAERSGKSHGSTFTDLFTGQAPNDV